MIEVCHLRFRSLEIESLSIPKGLTFIRGKNGCGKTTFLELAAGIRLPESGTILIDGKTPREIHAGYVSEFPSRSLVFSRVSDEISSALRFLGLSETEIRRETEETAEAFRITHLLSRDCRTLSGGEKVLTAVAAAAVGSPELIVLDEPDSHFDAETACETADALRERKIPYILWASHKNFLNGFEVRL